MNIEPRDPRQNPRMAKEVERVRQAWESRGSHVGRPRKNGTPASSRQVPKILLSFDEMLDALLVPCISYTDIAAACDCSRERVRQVHRDYFATLIPYRSHGRQKTCTILARAETRRNLKPQGLAGLFAAAAVRHGLTGGPIVLTNALGGMTASSRELMVNGFRIRCWSSQSARKSYSGAKAGHYHFNLDKSLDEYDFAALRCGMDDGEWFIFPAHLLDGKRYFYIRERQNTYHKNAHVTRWMWQYREAWHLLKEDGE